MSRSALMQRLERMVGTDVARVLDAQRGWPSLVQLSTFDGPVLSALHVSPVGPGSRGNIDEHRIQNPGKNHPIQHPRGVIPLLLGIWEHQAEVVLVGMDAFRRVGLPTRWSGFCPLPLLRSVSKHGWNRHSSESGERLFAFKPRLLPTYVTLVARGLTDVAAYQPGLQAQEELSLDASARDRLQAELLIRRGWLGLAVEEAYGQRCAMCGATLAMPDATYLCPAEQPDSPNAVRNALALCRLHRWAWDQHLVAVEPGTHRLLLHPELRRRVEQEGIQQLLGTTRELLAAPRLASERADDEMLLRRYTLFCSAYNWVSLRAG